MIYKNRAKNFSDSILLYYSKLSTTHQKVTVPSILALLLLLIVLSIKSVPLPVSGLLLMLWLIISAGERALIHFSDKSAEEIKTSSAVWEYVGNQTDITVQKKILKLQLIYKSGEGKTDIHFRRHVREHASYETMIQKINEKLYLCLREYLESTNKLKHKNREINLMFCMLVDGGDGYFHSKGNQKNPTNPFTVPPITDLKCDNRKTLAGKLWADKTIKKDLLLINNMDDKQGMPYTKFDENDNTESIICFKVIDPIDGSRSAIWSVHSDQKNTFSDAGFEQGSELVKLFNHFSIRIQLEILFEKTLIRMN